MLDATRKTLFSPYDLNGLELKNLVVVASMTRSRTGNEGLVPTELRVEHYRQRASAGLILTESTWIGRDSIGFINVPGLFTAEQTEGWRKVVEAVHAAAVASTRSSLTQARARIPTSSTASRR
jgi:N-ethylmaleimide reductase